MDALGFSLCYIVLTPHDNNRIQDQQEMNHEISICYDSYHGVLNCHINLLFKLFLGMEGLK